jgi:hypothetical protein
MKLADVFLVLGGILLGYFVPVLIDINLSNFFLVHKALRRCLLNVIRTTPC